MTLSQPNEWYRFLTGMTVECAFRSIRQSVPISNRQVNPIQFVNSRTASKILDV